MERTSNIYALVVRTRVGKKNGNSLVQGYGRKR